MKLKTFAVTDVSTCHISKQDNDILQKNSNCDEGGPNAATGYPLTVLRYYHGYLVGVWLWDPEVGASAMDRKDAEKKLLAEGNSPAFINLLRISGKQGAKWLCLDCDGEDYEDLPEHEW